MRIMRQGASVILAVAIGWASFAAQAAMTADQVRRQVERDSGGKVLKIEPRKFGDLAAFEVTVMNAGGNDNGAFQVYTVIVSAENGTTVSEQRQHRHY
jgi:uncharacterized membrane protein YkoI